MKKISKEEVLKYFKEHGGWNVVGEYIDYHTPVIIERDGYLAMTSLSNFKINNNCVVFGARNPFFKQNIETLIKKKTEKVKFINAQQIKKAGKSRILVTMLDENNHLFKKTLEHIMSDKHLCCKICARKQLQEDMFEKRYDNWLKAVEQKGYKILDKPKHLTSQSKIKIESKSSGYRYNVNINSLKYIKNPLTFSRFSNKEFLLYNLNLYKENNGLISTPLRVSEKQIDTKNITMVFQCACGKTYETTVQKWALGQDVCKNCKSNKSKYERMITNALTTLNVDFIEEFVFKNCKDKYSLSFDFYLPKFNAVIEADGEQHYFPVAFSGNYDVAQKRFSTQKQHDEIKTKYCAQNKIPLLRIPYWEFREHNWQNILNNFIKQLKRNEL